MHALKFLLSASLPAHVKAVGISMHLGAIKYFKWKPALNMQSRLNQGDVPFIRRRRKVVYLLRYSSFRPKDVLQWKEYMPA
ncbi:hypothetical protein CC2G_004060 [Coprinopsis cinerea AmutBmut pab1-1]|nr:hypothetical protein CC2G_004060 [Coprinopsis cinerea AmutBmut pab1-1]